MLTYADVWWRMQVSGAGLLLASAGDMDPVLGTYARGVQYAGTAGPSLFDSSSLAQRESASCPQVLYWLY
jgi:hypothetical protein